MNEAPICTMITYIVGKYAGTYFLFQKQLLRKILVGQLSSTTIFRFKSFSVTCVFSLCSFKCSLSRSRAFRTDFLKLVDISIFRIVLCNGIWFIIQQVWQTPCTKHIDSNLAMHCNQCNLTFGHVITYTYYLSFKVQIIKRIVWCTF